jgi:hypothetical protein
MTWSYWLRNVRDLDLGREGGEQRKEKPSSFEADKRESSSINGGREEIDKSSNRDKLPCRFSVFLNGVEWFVYNRSAAYDAVVAGMTATRPPESVPDGPLPPDPKVRKRNIQSKDSEKEDVNSKISVTLERESYPSLEKDSFSMHRGEPKSQETFMSQTATNDSRNNEQGSSEGAFILRFLPIQIICNKAAIVLGNENTKSVLITKADKATGVIDASKSHTLDQYKQLINFDLDHPIVQIKPNDDYKEDQTAAAIRIKRGDASPTEAQENHVHTHSFLHRQRRKAWHKLQDLVPAFRSSVDSISSSEGLPDTSSQPGPGVSSWQGLSRYLDADEQDDRVKWSSIEYATVSTIIDTQKASISFYWDVVGTVPEITTQVDINNGKDTMNINGNVSPDWGLNMSLKGTVINYGPWADRQRADLQRVFFPSLCKDAILARKLVPGQFRVPTEFKLYIELDDETMLRVPIREESKNWKWAKQADSMGARQTQEKTRSNKHRKRKTEQGNTGHEVRPFGWLDVKVGANSTVAYVMDMIAGSSGFSSKLELDLKGTEITTSVNHGLLWRSVDNKISCDLSSPLKWNGHRDWTFDIESSGLELFILREHVFLLTDLVDDWASGPPPDYLTYTPFRYLVNLHLRDFKIYLNLNDSNIINNPSDFDDNTFIVIFGSVLNCHLCIPLDVYRPYKNDITFDIDARTGGLNLHVPPWNTQATFMDTTEIATLKELKINGKYQYCATTSASNTDTLLLTVYGVGPTAQFYGFVIRYFLKIKDNYFGDDIRFRTLEEYQDVLRARRDGGDENPNPQPHKKSNVFNTTSRSM